MDPKNKQQLALLTSAERSSETRTPTGTVSLSGKELVAAKLAEADDGPLTLAEFVGECLEQDD